MQGGFRPAMHTNTMRRVKFKYIVLNYNRYVVIFIVMHMDVFEKCSCFLIILSIIKILITMKKLCCWLSGKLIQITMY